MFKAEQNSIEEKIIAYCQSHNLPRPDVQWKYIPFSGHWGISTSFFSLASQEGKEQGVKINVAQRAQEIAEQVAEYLGSPQGFEKLEAVRGYLNLYFSTGEYTQRIVDTVLDQREKFGNGESKHERVMVEFSQPNTHKAFHVGHLRNVILGDSVCNILEAAGYDVVRSNYIGDIGLHVIKWLWNYTKNHAGEEPEQDVTRWMGNIYAEADRYYEDPAVEAEVRALFGRWSRRDPEVTALWEKTRDWSMKGFHQVYDLLGVRFDHFYFESEVEDSGVELVDGLIEKGLARDERPKGAVIIPLDEILGLEETYRVLVILRSDGTSLYATKDIPLAIKKFEQYHLDRSVYVIDVRQSLYMQQIFKTLELMGYEWASRLHHLAYEIVNLPGNVTMSSRDGTVVLLEDLIKEATGRALEIVKEKNAGLSEENQTKIAQAVALGAIKYSMLSRDNTKIVTFDWNAALDFNGQAAPYIQYAYVRANSILKKAEGELPGSFAPTYELAPVEVELINVISRLPNEIQRSAKDMRPLLISNIAFELAKAFNDFYNQCPVLQAEPEIRDMRLRLVAASRQAIANCLRLLGIQAPDVM
ncbi:MAG: arginine--tRNA ligase [Chloroflexi bacterium]|nr:arginine--tRNA ligase [Chloroflexota bacterium]